MRDLRRNRRKMYYSLNIGNADIFETDKKGNIRNYIDSDGNKYPLKTGMKEITYSTPVEFYSNISTSGGSSDTVEYGYSTSDYQCIATFPKGKYPIVEGTLIWRNSPIQYKYGGDEVEIEISDGTKVKTMAPLKTSADYTCIKVSDSLNITKVILKATEKSNTK